MSKDNNGHHQIIRGLPFPNESEFQRKNIEDAMDYNPKDGDIIIASYPKTGITWLEYIVLQILSKGTLFPTFDELTWNVIPFFEMAGKAAVEAAPEPRMYKHHLPYGLTQHNKNSKCLYMYRSPEDVVVSYHRFLQSYDEDSPIDFNSFFDDFLAGDIAFGSFFDHVLSYYVHRDEPNLLLVSYEKLHANIKDEILRIAKFLGEEHNKCLIEDEALLFNIMKNTSFEHMKKNLYLTHPDYLNKDVRKDDKKLINFFRKGLVGDGKNVLSESQRTSLRACMENSMKGTDILQEWLNH